MFIAPNPYQVLEDAQKVLHPGAVGLIMHHHGSVAGGRAVNLVDTIKAITSNIRSAPSLVLDVCMPDLIGDYETADNVPEWDWVSLNASMSHQKNGESGIYEFLLNLGNFRAEDCDEILKDAPKTIQILIKEAVNNQYGYILFHQGT